MKRSEFLLLTLSLYVYESFAFLYVCALCIYLVPTKTRKGPQVPWTWNYKGEL